MIKFARTVIAIISKKYIITTHTQDLLAKKNRDKGEKKENAEKKLGKLIKIHDDP